MDLTSEIIAWEDGTLGESDTIKLFQRLIDSGMAWKLQGVYGRTANDLIEAGLCHLKGQK